MDPLLLFLTDGTVSKRSYHAQTRGLVLNEVIRRVDPQGRTLGEILRQKYYQSLHFLTILFYLFRSSQVIFQDAENALVTVTLFQRVVDEYRHKARENKFMVRDFVYNPDELQAGKNELTKLVTDKKKQFGPLVRNCNSSSQG